MGNSRRLLSRITNAGYSNGIVPRGYPSVATFADLPSSALYVNDIYAVLTTTGIFPFRKKAGLYISDSVNWKWYGSQTTINPYAPSYSYTLNELVFTSDGIIYKSLQSSNIGNDPLSAPLLWENITVPVMLGTEIGQMLFWNGSSWAKSEISSLIWDNINKSLGIGSGTPDSSAVLQLESTTKGFLPPRMTSVEQQAIVSPANGLIVKNIDDDILYEYDEARNKWLSIEVTALQFGENGANDNAYLRFGGDMRDGNGGARLPFDGVIIRVTTFTTGGDDAKGFDVEINGTSVKPYNLVANAYTSLYDNINFNANDRINVFVTGAGLGVLDPTAIVWVKWRK